ncbi:hypothetical protein [Natrinema sp. DC36]|uniref:hypothetical protein n=1 Tax=Natrinema sp. DC36 TaxID=2878680 RepID=UPI001CF0CC56|nr:hypothetical protein [Natrinema sp. DC36]
MRREQSRAQWQSKAERNLAYGLSEIRRIVASLGFAQSIRDQTCSLFRTAQSERLCRGRSLEAEAVGYIVGRYFGLDTSGSAFYLAAWEGEESEAILDRLERISSAAQEIIDAVNKVGNNE